MRLKNCRQLLRMGALVTVILLLVHDCEAQRRSRNGNRNNNGNNNRNGNGAAVQACTCPYGASGDGYITIQGNTCQIMCGGKCTYSHNGYFSQTQNRIVHGLNAFDCYGHEVPVFDSGTPPSDPGANEPPTIPAGGGSFNGGGNGAGGNIGGGGRGRPKPRGGDKPDGGGNPGPTDPGPRMKTVQVWVQDPCGFFRDGRPKFCDPKKGHWEERQVYENIRLPKEMRNTSVSNPYTGTQRKLNKVSRLISKYELAPEPIMLDLPSDAPASGQEPNSSMDPPVNSGGDPSSNSNPPGSGTDPTGSLSGSGSGSNSGGGTISNNGNGSTEPPPSTGNGNGTPTSCPELGCVFSLPSVYYIVTDQDDPEWDEAWDDYWFPVGSFNGAPAFVHRY